jgi:hypothetical protein
MSSTKKVILPIQIVTSGDMSANITQGTTAVTTKPVTNIQFLDNIGIQFVWTGTPTGQFFVDVSLDNANWDTLSITPTILASGSASSAYVDLNQMSATYLRVRYVVTSSTGTLNAYLTAKEV